MRTYIKYDTQDGDGSTRRSRNSRFGKSHLNKEVEVPDEGSHLWNWFWEISRCRDSNDNPISYTDIGAWRSFTGNLIDYDECGILLSMDLAFRSALQDEIKANTAIADARRGKGVK